MPRLVLSVLASIGLYLQGCASTYSQLAGEESPCPITMAAHERLRCALETADSENRRDVEFSQEVRIIGRDLEANSIDEQEAHRRLEVMIVQFEQQERLANQRNAALAVAGVALVGLAAAAADAEGGAPASNYYTPQRQDRGWAWDRFVGANGTYQWRCRGIQTGRFAPSERCAGQPRVDTRWPG